MKVRDLRLLAIPPHAPTTVSATSDGRLVAFDLEPGEPMPATGGEGAAWLMPIAGEVELVDDRGKRVLAGPASLVELEPGECPEIRGRTRARLLLMLAGDGAAPEARTGEAASSTA